MNAPELLPAVSPTEADRAHREGATLLDVREYDEWMAGHVDGAVHVPMSELPARVGSLDRTGRIVCICRSGNRSGQVTAWLVQQGFDAVNMTGGMRAWAADELPYVNFNGNPGTVI
jgi:rhodanese-related sulfurtransferase